MRPATVIFTRDIARLSRLNNAQMTSPPPFRAALDALPLFIPALPFAFVFGVVVAEAGIPQWLGWSSSPIIFWRRYSGNPAFDR